MINKNLISELTGTFFLSAGVIGSGIMAGNLSNGNIALSLLSNTVATGSILYVIIKMFSSISGAHFNPVVSYVFYLNGYINKNIFFKYVFVQLVGSCLGVLTTHYLFGLDLLQVSNNHRGEIKMFFSETIGTFGLISTILFIKDNDEKALASGVALFICAGYWFIPSTCFANPAILVGRVFTNSFTGIAPSSFLYFFLGQVFGAISAYFFYNQIKNKQDE